MNSDDHSLHNLTRFGTVSRRVAATLFYVSVLYCCLVALAIAINALFIPSFDEVGHLTNGCYKTDALVIYIECRGFFGAEVMSQFLTVPWLLVLGPALLLLNPIYAIALWVPVVYPGYYLFRIRRVSGSAQS
jgi:hypothetical protein